MNSIKLFISSLVTSITLACSISLLGMENDAPTPQYHRAHFYIGTSEFNNKKCSPFNADTNNAIQQDCISQLYRTNTEHIFITYNLLTSLQHAYKEARDYFDKKNIKDPLSQIMIEPADCMIYLAGGIKKASPAKKRASFLKHPNCSKHIIEESPLNDNYQPYVLKKKYGSKLIDHFKIIIGLQNWQWYDTCLGLYYLTRKPTPTIDVNSFSKLDNPLSCQAQEDSNAWIDHLGSIIASNNKNIQSVHWAIHISGHGSPKEKGFKCTTAGLSEAHIASFFNFFNTQITTDVISIQSCYTDSLRILSFAQKYCNIDHFNYTIFSTLSDDKKVSFDSGSNDICSYYPPWINAKNHFVTSTFHITSLLKKIQKITKKNNNNAIARNTSIIEFLKKYPFYPNPSLLLAQATEQLEIVANSDAQYP